MNKLSLIISFVVCIIAMIIPTSLHAQKHVNENDTINILWIGNSYTFYNDLPTMTKEIAEDVGIIINNTTVLKGGQRLSGHLKNPVLHEQLTKGEWDYVVIQELSTTPAYSSKYVMEHIYPYASEIDSIAHVYSPDVKTLFYMTWGHKNGSQRQTEYPLDDTYSLMQDRIINTYIDLAYELGGWCVPVGIAWKKVRTEFPEIELYNPDNTHPSLEGSYLAANTFFATLYGKPFVSNTVVKLDDDIKTILQQCAINTVMENKKILNIR